MARKRKNNQPDINGMSVKMMKRRKPINQDYLIPIEPKNETQQKVFDAYNEGKCIYSYGVAGTGKTFVPLYLALQDVLNEDSPYEKVYVVRSLVATREIGFLPGTHEDKASLYQIPYKKMVQYMFEMPDDASFDMLYENLKNQETISFWSTSFLRGTTLDDCIIIVDECQNLNFHELDSIMTRVGQNCKILFCGDFQQSDLKNGTEKDGILNFQRILQNMPEFEVVEYGIEDIVRSGLVKSYIITKLNLGL